MNARTQRKIGLTVLLPLVSCKTHNLPKPQKQCVMGTFPDLLEHRICAISLVRLYYNTQSEYMATHFTEHAGIAVMLGALEANLTITCACLPAFPSLRKPFLERLRSNFSSKKSGSFRGLFYNFLSRRTRRPTPGSVKINSSAEGLGPEHLSVPTDAETMELARFGGRTVKWGNVRC